MPTPEPRQPLWMPKGSVRAILALLLTMAAVAMGGAALGYGMVSGLLDGPSAVAIVLAVLGLAQLAVGFYFMTRGQQRDQ